MVFLPSSTKKSLRTTRENFTDLCKTGPLAAAPQSIQGVVLHGGWHSWRIVWHRPFLFGVTTAYSSIETSTTGIFFHPSPSLLSSRSAIPGLNSGIDRKREPHPCALVRDNNRLPFQTPKGFPCGAGHKFPLFHFPTVNWGGSISTRSEHSQTLMPFVGKQSPLVLGLAVALHRVNRWMKP